MIHPKKSLILFLLISGISISGNPVFAADTSCIKDPANPPCGGAKGKCTINSDGSPGGFVADTAKVEKAGKPFHKIQPYLGIYTQVCDQARVSGETYLLDEAKITGNAQVSSILDVCLDEFGSIRRYFIGPKRGEGLAVVGEHALISDHAKVCSVGVGGHAHIFEHARVVDRGNAILKVSTNGNPAVLKGDYTITGNAEVFGNTMVDRAHISGNAQVYGNALVQGSGVFVYENAQVYGDAIIKECLIYGNAQVYGAAEIDGGKIFGNARVFDYSRVSGSSIEIYGDAQVYENARIFDWAQVYDQARVFGHASLLQYARVFGSGEVAGNRTVGGHSEVTQPLMAAIRAPFPENSRPASHLTQPPVHFREYHQSEAEALVESHARRMGTNTFQNTVCLNGTNIGIEEKDLHPARLKSYTILDPNLAKEIGLWVNQTLTQEQLETHPASSTLINALSNQHPVKIKVEDSVLNPKFDPRPVSVEEHTYIDYLRAEIDHWIDALNRTAPGGYYIHPATVNGQLYLNGHQDDENSNTHQQIYLKLADAIKRNDEKSFIKNTVQLATLFDRAHTEAKRAFIDTFTVLFVTKEFPSEGIRQNYYHFILRCGHIF